MPTSRLVAYVDAKTIDQLEDADRWSKSGFAREAIEEKLEREGLD